MESLHGGGIRGSINRVSIVVSALVLATALLVAPAAHGQVAQPRGGSAADAAASCWEIKQNDPDAASGVYWLQTPELGAPGQFYCDMVTDGGGWVLIGRGREDWRPEYTGLGSAAEVRSQVTGPGAFDPAQLDSRVVNALLGDLRVDELQDGIRVRRAKNTSGTQWQEVRFRLAQRDRWVWTFEAGLRLGSWDFGGGSGSGSGGTTDQFGNADWFHPYNSIMTRESPEQGWQRGWAYGPRVEGTNAPGSYLWSASDGQGGAIPFSQVYLRPKLTQHDLTYEPIPDSGTPVRELSSLLRSGALPQQWGVTGRATPNDGEHYTPARAFTQVGDTVFVGGNFEHVQKGPNPGPGERIRQSYLAGFDVHTGEWVSSFRPTFNGPVRALETLPSGKLVAAGEFTEVNGRPALGIVALDPVTGAIDTSWRVVMENRLSCCEVSVWDLQVHGDRLYIAGKFTHIRGGEESWWAYTRDAGRVSVVDGNADSSWNPEFNGTVFDIDISADGERLYAAGHFTWSQHQTADKVATVSTEAGADLVSGLKQPRYSTGNGHYQQAIVEAGDRVWVGGSEHSLFSYSTSDFGLLSTNITKRGGDFQAAEEIGGVVYATCHCSDWNFSGADTWPDVGNDWTQADKIGWIGAWDAETGEYIPTFSPWLNTNRGQGAWDVFQDSTGVVWFSGDFRQGRTNGGSFTWLGGFVRFAPRDTSAPSSPSGLTSTDLGDGTMRLDWHGSADDSGAVDYEILLDDRVVATTPWQTEVVLPAEAGRYFVRAVDRAGNRSASTPVLTIPGQG